MDLLYKHENGSYIVRENRSRVFTMTVNDMPVSFNVDYLPSDKYEWFCSTVGKLFQTVACYSSLKAKKEVADQFKKLMGLEWLQ